MYDGCEREERASSQLGGKQTKEIIIMTCFSQRAHTVSVHARAASADIGNHEI